MRDTNPIFLNNIFGLQDKGEADEDENLIATSLKWKPKAVTELSVWTNENDSDTSGTSISSSEYQTYWWCTVGLHLHYALCHYIAFVVTFYHLLGAFDVTNLLYSQICKCKKWVHPHINKIWKCISDKTTYILLFYHFRYFDNKKSHIQYVELKYCLLIADQAVVEKWERHTDSEKHRTPKDDKEKEDFQLIIPAHTWHCHFSGLAIMGSCISLRVSDCTLLCLLHGFLANK